MAAPVSGTFQATGPSSGITGSKIAIKMDFAGTASVDVEVLLTGTTWIKLSDATGITADYYKVFDSPVAETVRLNCTAYTNDVVYSLTTN